MTFTIVFDFPEADGPVFAGMLDEGLGFAPTLATALTFDEEATAERTLAYGYGWARRCGTVVEVVAS